MELISQNKQIKAYLLNGGKLTQLKALRMFGCLRLSGRIWELRESGLNIHTDMIRVGKKMVAEYSILPEK